MDLNRFLGIVVRWSWLIIICAVIAGATAYFVTGRLPKSYESQATVLVGNVKEVNYEHQLAYQQLAEMIANLATTKPVLEKVAGRVPDSPSASSIRDAVDVRSQPGQGIIKVQATDGDPETAAIIANGVALEVIELARPATGVDSLASIVEPAEAASSPSSPSLTINLVVAILLGAALGTALAVSLSLLRARRRAVPEPWDPYPPFEYPAPGAPQRK